MYFLLERWISIARLGSTGGYQDIHMIHVDDNFHQKNSDLNTREKINRTS